jgi:hypothetical protein
MSCKQILSIMGGALMLGVVAVPAQSAPMSTPPGGLLNQIGGVEKVHDRHRHCHRVCHGRMHRGHCHGHWELRCHRRHHHHWR